MDWSDIEIVPGLVDVIWAAYSLGFDEGEGKVFFMGEEKLTKFLVDLRNKWGDCDKNEEGDTFADHAVSVARKKYPYKRADKNKAS